MTTGGLVLIAVGVVVVWLGLAGYQDWGPAQRAIALILGGADALGFGLLLVLLIRQQIAGRPPVRATTTGLAVGSTVIPWVEIDEVGAVSLFALPHVGVLQRTAAPRRLTGLRSIQYLSRGDQRMLFLAARQVGTDLDADVERVRAAWSRARSTATDS